MSWSVNWPMNVEPAVIVGLSGLVPYGLLLVGLPFTAGSTIRAFGPSGQVIVGVHDAARHPDFQQRGPYGVGSRCERLQFGKIRPEEHAVRPRVPGTPCYRGDVTAARAALPNPGSTPADAAASPAPASPAPLRSRLRDTPVCSLPAISIPLPVRPLIVTAGQF